MKVVIALGGNMISDSSNKTETFADQQHRIETTAKIIADIIEQDHSVVITHGNGPQVGSLLLQQQKDISGSVNLPLKILGALTQGQIGVVLQHAILNELKNRNKPQEVVVIPTSVIVDKNDPGFNDPSKPVGPSYTEEEFKNLKKDPQHKYKKTASGYRRIVPSPVPVDILEMKVIKKLSKDCIVIAGGGGGTPTTVSSNGYSLQDAVIDKDLASSLLATELDADLLMILTNVDGVYRNFDTPKQEMIKQLSKAEAEKLIDSEEVSKGSMEPKVRAALNFAGTTVITSPENTLDALAGSAGTRIEN